MASLHTKSGLNCDVRFTPQSTHQADGLRCPLSANSDIFRANLPWGSYLARLVRPIASRAKGKPRDAASLLRSVVYSTTSVGMRSTGRDTLWKLGDVAITALWISTNCSRGAAALDADNIAQLFVARRYGRIDAEEAAKIDLAVGLDLELFQRDPAHRTLRDVTHCHAGVKRREQMLLRIGERVGAAKLEGLVDVDREFARRPARRRS